jgi:cytochrome c oxidase subunit 4
VEARWTKLPEAEQGAIADSLLAAQKADWKLMTMDEKRAAYYIAYGNYGARTPRDPAFDRKVFGWVAAALALGGVIWAYGQTKCIYITFNNL